MSKADDLFFKEFGAILVALTVFGFAMYFLASHIGGGAFQAVQNSSEAVAERIAPIGQVRVDGDAVPEPAAPAAPAAAAGQSGEDVYASACAACHTAGVAGAPKTGDAAAWTPRHAQGVDALVAGALKGKGAMPAKGGNAALSDDEVRSAVMHMLAAAGLEVAAETTPATAPAAEPAAEAEAAPEAAPEATPAAAGQPAAPMPAATAAGPAGDSAAGEKIYGSACIACHAAGVAGAPKTGDTAAWQARAGVGVEGLVKTVITGKGAMPPKAGNASLSEDDIRNAVIFLLEQAGVGSGAAAPEPTATAPAAAAEAAPAAMAQAAPAAETTPAAAPAQASGDTAAGEKIYGSACIACHAAGVAGAPKLTDKAAWESRAGGGVDALVKSVISGKGAMPPKAGNASLSEDDIRNAVAFMLMQAGVPG